MKKNEEKNTNKPQKLHTFWQEYAQQQQSNNEQKQIRTKNADEASFINVDRQIKKRMTRHLNALLVITNLLIELKRFYRHQCIDTFELI